MVLSTPHRGNIIETFNNNVTIADSKVKIVSGNTPRWSSMSLQLVGTAAWTASGTTTKTPAVSDVSLYPLYISEGQTGYTKLSGAALARYAIRISSIGTIVFLSIELVTPNTSARETNQSTNANSVGDIVIAVPTNIVVDQEVAAIFTLAKTAG